MTIRRGEPCDLPAVAAIQEASPEAGRWNVADYLNYDFEVAVCGANVAGFRVARALGEGECELLNLAVEPSFRRKGIGRRLLETLLAGPSKTVWLEVRESNATARNLYGIMGFQEAGRRNEYYSSPDEAGIVMKFHSC
jgi:ribosomal-protein-alanine N-acetyltransferase